MLEFDYATFGIIILGFIAVGYMFGIAATDALRQWQDRVAARRLPPPPPVPTN